MCSFFPPKKLPFPGIGGIRLKSTFKLPTKSFVFGSRAGDGAFFTGFPDLLLGHFLVVTRTRVYFSGEGLPQLFAADAAFI